MRIWYAHEKGTSGFGSGVCSHVLGRSSLIRSRGWIIALVGCVTLVCVALVPSLRINDDFDELALQNDSDFRFFETFLRQFGHDEIIVVAFGAEDILSKENLSLLERLESQFKEVPHVGWITL
jgi:predicted RND superfamily exporter protein